MKSDKEIRPEDGLKEIYSPERIETIKKQMIAAAGSMFAGNGDTVIAQRSGNAKPVKDLIIQGHEGDVREFPLTPGSFLIGRLVSANIRILEDKQVSRIHCELTVHSDGRITLRDLKSSNGTWVEEEEVSNADPMRKLKAEEAVSIKDGGVFSVGRTIFMVMPV